MELTPLPGIQHDDTAVRAPTADFHISTVVNMQAVARSDHSARPATRKKAANTTEAAEDEDPASADEYADTIEDPSESHISFFA